MAPALRRLALAGGGTAGHVYPAASIAKGAADHLIWLGRDVGMERELAAALGIEFAPIAAGAVLGRGPVDLLRSALLNARGIIQARSILRRVRPNALLATGGYVSFPAVIAAWSLRIPTVIYLPDVKPGLAVRVLSRFATRMACTTAESRRFLPADRVVVTGYPIRGDLRDWADRPNRRTDARAELGIGDEPVVVVMGGSLGAQAVNEAIWANLDTLIASARVIHITGARGAERAEIIAQGLADRDRGRYQWHAFVTDQLGPILAAADLFVGRAGASILGELPPFGLPGLVIPGSFAAGHQNANAEYFARAGAGWTFTGALPERGRELTERVLAVVGDRKALAAAGDAARALDLPEAAARIRTLLSDISRGRTT